MFFGNGLKTQDYTVISFPRQMENQNSPGLVISEKSMGLTRNPVTVMLRFCHYQNRARLIGNLTEELVMFEIKDIDPAFYRKQTRNATLKIMAIFIVIGMITATSFVEYLGPYSSNHIVLNLLGAFVGLVITGLIVRFFFKDSAWMNEAMYGWRLKRSLMHITNVIDKVKAKANHDDEKALKILRFYHLGLTQMYQLEENSHELIEIKSEKEQLVQRLVNLGIDINQTRFDPSMVEEYKDHEASQA
jgi:hypothetical protein